MCIARLTRCGWITLCFWLGWAGLVGAQPKAVPGQPPELRLVPRDAAGFVLIRAADLWKSDSLADFRQLLQAAGPDALRNFEKHSPFPFSLVDRLTVILLTTETLLQPVPHQVDPEAMSALLVVRTSKPYDREALSKAFIRPGRLKEYRGKSYYFNEDSWSGLYLVDDLTFVLGTEDAVVQWLDRLEAKASGPLELALPVSAEERHLLAAINPAQLGPVAAGAPPAIQALFQARCAVLTAQAGKDLQGDLRLHYATDDAARDGEKAVRALLELAQQGLAQPLEMIQARLAEGSQADSAFERTMENLGMLFGLGILRQFETVLKEQSVQRQGAVVRLPLRTPPNAFLSNWAVVSVAAISALGQSAQATFTDVGAVIGGRPNEDVENHLRELGRALEKYHEANGHYPLPALSGRDRQPLLSWRVALLPYIGEEELYRQFKLDEPWDSLHNKRLLKHMPKVFRHPREYRYRWKTGGQAVVGAGAIFDGQQAIRKKDVTDGLGQTLLLALADPDHAVPWTKPADLPFVPGKPLPEITRPWQDGFFVLMADGSIRFLKRGTDAKTLQALITRSGNDKAPE